MLRIGLIDSGIGGFSILRAFLEVPLSCDIEFIYIADSGHLPYGLKTPQYIHQRMQVLTAFLVTQNIDALVIACNTATAVSAVQLRDANPLLPVIGTEPAIKPAALASMTGHIAVAATQSTLESARLNALIDRYAANCTVHKIIGTSWVELVESQRITADSNLAVLQETLQVFKEFPIDQLVLGCTHFPFLEPALGTLLSDKVNIIDPAKSIVQECFNRLDLCGDIAQMKDRYSEACGKVSVRLFTTGDLDVFIEQTDLLPLENISREILKLEA